MREALLIFRKDVHHLWPRIIPMMVVTALWGWTESGLFAFDAPLRYGWLLAAAFLVTSVIQQEALPGHQQYWLTRPYHGGHLVLAKALFLAVFIWLPILAIEAISLAVNGMSWWRHILLILATTLVFACWVCSSVAALACITENLVQFLWGFLPAFGVVILGSVLTSRNDHTIDWGDLEWIRDSAFLLVVTGAAFAVLFLQYSRRKTTASRCLLGAAILIAAAGLSFSPWHAAWAIESKLSQRLHASAARLEFDPGARTRPGFADATYSPGAGQMGINLPIRIAGIPAGTQVVSERIMAQIEAPDGGSSVSTWTQAGGLYRTTPLEDAHLIPVDGAYWEYVNVDDDFYQAVRDTPVRVHTTVALTLLGGRTTTPLVTRDRDGFSSDDRVCRVFPAPFAKLMVFCAWLGHGPARAYVTAISSRTGQTFASLISGSSGPFPLNGSVWWRDAALFSPPPATHEMELETWQAVAHFDRDLDLPQIRLADYAVRRITDMP